MAVMSTIFKDLLEAASVGVFGAETGWGIFIGRQPASPDTSITVYDSGGMEPNPRWLLDFPSIQVRLRGADGGYVAARQKAQDVKDVLLRVTPQTIGSDRLVGIYMNGDIFLLGYDANNRPEFTMNFRTIFEPGTNALTHREPLAP